MAIVTSGLLNALRVGFSREFETAKSGAASDWDKVATRVSSTSASTTYGWLGQYPKLREWTGDRTFKSMQEHSYSVVNKLYESTVGVKRTDMEDDNLGVYSPLVAEMGYAVAVHPDELVFALLNAGRATDCYDGKKFFAADHPVYPNVDGTGAASSASNLLRPAEVSDVVTDKTPWYLLDVSRPLKPFIFQERSKPELTVITDVQSERVFMKDEYAYGVRYRCNAGFGFWQQAVCCTDTLDADTFELALTAMQSFRADGGRPLGLGRSGKAGLMLVVPSSLFSAAKSVVDVQLVNGGESNKWYDAATIINCPWLEA